MIDDLRSCGRAENIGICQVDAFSDINLYSDRSVTIDFKACFAAFDATIKSIIYMNQFAPDIEPSSRRWIDDGPNPQLRRNRILAQK